MLGQPGGKQRGNADAATDGLLARRDRIQKKLATRHLQEDGLVHEGNTADSKTFRPAVQKLREDFGIQRVVMVGDRGMVSQKAIDPCAGRARAVADEPD
ncbi:MAG: hypothetical protein Q8K05_18535 [Polaromonas sp.]|uniref:hypothetical protein n=1 Tax=Polaromonas sp. TaxID=1869339 RepID=UPI002730F35D|nr:hypothetical protein [Polaromonas sp.]MDP2258024.1 hypothetical protein [Polaromonas sp.]